MRARIHPSQSLGHSPLHMPILPYIVKQVPAFYAMSSSITVCKEPAICSRFETVYPASPVIIFLNYFKITIPSIFGSCKWYLSLGFRTKTMYAFLLSDICATCPCRINRFDFIALTELLVARRHNVNRLSCSDSRPQPAYQRCAVGTPALAFVLPNAAFPAPETPSDSPCLSTWSRRKR
jgi:hypothetical protein